MSEKRKTLEQRFWAKVGRGHPDGCWEWLASTGPGGYGRFGVPGMSTGWLHAHRMSWTLSKGEIPDGMYVCHVCDNPPCVNPRHLFLGTPADNMADKIRKGRHMESRTRKLTEAAVREIRGTPPRGGVSRKELAKKFGVGESAIYKVLNRKNWRHVP